VISRDQELGLPKIWL